MFDIKAGDEYLYSTPSGKVKLEFVEGKEKLNAVYIPKTENYPYLFDRDIKVSLDEIKSLLAYTKAFLNIPIFYYMYTGKDSFKTITESQFHDLLSKL